MTRLLLVMMFGGMMVLLGSIYGILLDSAHEEIVYIEAVDKTVDIEVESEIRETNNHWSTTGKDLNDTVSRIIAQLIGN